MDGDTITRERLTYLGAEPDMYDWLEEQVDPDPRWVLRRHGRIVASEPATSDLARWLEQCVEEYGAVLPDAPERVEHLVLGKHRADLAVDDSEPLPIAV